MVNPLTTEQKVILDYIHSKHNVEGYHRRLHEMGARINEVFISLEDDEEPTEKMKMDHDDVEKDMESE